MTLTARDVEELTRLLDNSRFSRLVLEHKELKLDIVRAGAATGTAAPAPAAHQPADPAPVQPATPAEPTEAATQESRALRNGELVEVPSPLLGVYYRAPKPGEPPFVEVGSVVTEDTVIGIVEVMKLMNSVRAGRRGEVVEILVANGELVEHGQPILLIKPT